MISRLILIICFGFLLTNCAKSTYKPLVNFETSKNQEANSKYWKNLQVCNFIYAQNTGILADKWDLADKRGVIKKCMSGYGYSVLR